MIMWMNIRWQNPVQMQAVARRIMCAKVTKKHTSMDRDVVMKPFLMVIM